MTQLAAAADGQQRVEHEDTDFLASESGQTVTPLKRVGNSTLRATRRKFLVQHIVLRCLGYIQTESSGRQVYIHL